MKFLKNKKVIGIFIIVTVLVVAFFCSQDEPNQEMVYENVETVVTTQETQEVETEEKVEASKDKAVQDKKPDEVLTEEKIVDETNEVEKEIIDEKNYCSFLIKCDDILNNLDKLKPEKVSLVPQDGIILRKEKVEFSDGESVFDVLLRLARENEIHFEYVNTPMYNSSYVEGIANLYEFDCGELSGWRYIVNGSMASVGCSEYKLKNGDSVEWKYTCDFTF